MQATNNQEKESMISQKEIGIEQKGRSSIAILSDILAYSTIALPFIWHHPKLINKPWFQDSVNGWNGIRPWHILLGLFVISALLTSIWSILNNRKSKRKIRDNLHSFINIIFVFFIGLYLLAYNLSKELQVSYVHEQESFINDFWSPISPILILVILLWAWGSITKMQYANFARSRGNNGITKAKLWLVSIAVLFVLFWKISSFTQSVCFCQIYALLTWIWHRFTTNEQN